MRMDQVIPARGLGVGTSPSVLSPHLYLYTVTLPPNSAPQYAHTFASGQAGLLHLPHEEFVSPSFGRMSTCLNLSASFFQARMSETTGVRQPRMAKSATGSRTIPATARSFLMIVSPP